MFPFTNTFLHIIAAFSLFSNPHVTTYHHTSNPNTTPSPTSSQVMLKAVGNISQFGKTIHLTAMFPQNGGTVTGSVSGDCTGTIKGKYSGDNNGKQLQGTAYATCPIMFFDLKGTADFKGTINNNDTEANVMYVGKVNQETHNGMFAFSVSHE